MNIDSRRGLLLQQFASELKIWAKLSHPNVLPLLGFVLNFNGNACPSFVSPWMELGTREGSIKNEGLGDATIEFWGRFGVRGPAVIAESLVAAGLEARSERTTSVKLSSSDPDLARVMHRWVIS